MRIKLKEGKQKELILLAKQNETWEKLSEKLNINQCYLTNELKKEQRLLSHNLYNKLCKITGKNYGGEIIERLEDNWGRAKGGRMSRGNTKEITLPHDSIDLAEFYGIMLGDGNLTKIKSHKIGTYQIRIVGDSRYDKEYLLNHVCPLIKNLFDVEVVYYKTKERNALNLTVTSKNLIEFLEKKGFKAGDKIINQTTIPPWIKENKEFLKACVRGLYDTDGSAYKLTNQNSYQICFTNYNKTLMEEVRNSLISFGINVSQITKGRDIMITKKSELRKFLKDIGFNNIKHINKINTWDI